LAGFGARRAGRPAALRGFRASRRHPLPPSPPGTSTPATRPPVAQLPARDPGHRPGARRGASGECRIPLAGRRAGARAAGTGAPVVAACFDR
jgi:hypothetical protein